jgi:PilZ domain
MLTQADGGGDRRRFSRIAFHRPAVLTLGGRVTTCRVLDVALRGALLEMPEGFDGAPHARARIDIHLDEVGTEHILMDGELVHVEDGHVGFACDEIDLDSIAHLRRLVELNLGDEELLHRELGALVRARPH